MIYILAGHQKTYNVQSHAEPPSDPEVLGVLRGRLVVGYHMSLEAATSTTTVCVMVW